MTGGPCVTGVAVGSTSSLHRRGWSSRTVKTTWLGNRASFLGIGLVTVAFAAAIVVPALEANSAYGWYVAHGCAAIETNACGTHFATISRGHTWANTVGFLLLLFPLVAGVFVGAPLIAKELESGTFRFTWTQAAGRFPFELRRLVVLGVTVVACACVLGLLMGWYVHPFEALGQTSRWDSRLFNSTVLALPAWTAFSFALGALLGVVIRRTVPAMAVTTIIVGGLLAYAGEPAEGTRGSLTTKLLGFFPATARSPRWLGTTFSGPATRESFAPRGSWLVRTFTETPKGRPMYDIYASPLWSRISREAGGSVTLVRWLGKHHYTFWYSYQPASRYWTFEVVLAAVAAVLAALVVFAAVRLLRHVG